MKLSIKYLAVLALMFSASQAFGQSHFTEKTVRWIVDPAFPSSDFWITPVQNIPAKSGNKITLYFTSPNQTVATVQCEGVTRGVQIPSYGVATFTVPLEWEMQSSGLVENKGIHVYDKTDNITVTLRYSSSNGGEGMFCIPVSGLGSDYIVAGYQSYFFGKDSTSDYPSEFTITAAQDSTKIEITPFCDLRRSDSFPTINNIVAFPQGQKFELTLNRGQCVQYQAALAQNTDDYDVTGTVIHSNFPVAVVGGLMSPNIPPDFPYANYVCDMIPPTSKWGNTYYTLNNNQPQDIAAHDYNLYCMISSVPDQVIYRHDCISGTHTEAVLNAAFDHYYTEEEAGNKWYSDQPFMLVQYSNGSTYPDNVAGYGSSSEAVIYPKESFKQSIQFLTPNTAGVQQPNSNSYANIIVNIKDTSNVTIDHKKISNYTHVCLDDTSEMFIVPRLTDGEHSVSSDSGCGVYVYGYDGNNHTAYAWSGYNHEPPYTPLDTISPGVSFTNGITCVHAAISDRGTGLRSIVLDSTSNLTFSLDTGFVPNSGVAKSFADICVIDTTLTGYLYFDVTDIAGQGRSGMIIYTPSTPPAGVTIGSQTKVSATITPNPATNSIALNFSLPQTANVNFELSSVDGQRVLVWNADAQSAGPHSEAIDISALPNGDYLYRFGANSEELTGKLAIVH